MDLPICIIGGGPTGITLAYILGKLGKKCIIIDKNASLGGCHRVTRVNGLFSEHAPRVYSSSYLNTIMLLNKMNLNFTDLFTPYNFSIATIGGKSILNISISELSKLAFEFIKLLFSPDHGKTVSMHTFMTDNKFKDQTIDYIDRLCRLTDGAGADRYTLYEFLQLANQQSFYRLYQPRQPNDTGLFTLMGEKLVETRNVDILLNTSVEILNYDRSSNKILNIKTSRGIIYCSNVILAISPLDMYYILNKSVKTSYTFGNLSKWVTKSSYINDIGIMFHWDTKLTLPKVWGFPKSPWGIAFIVLSDYMDFKDSRSKTVITSCVTYLDVISPYTNKTAQQTANKDELIAEVFRQIKMSYPDYDLVNATTSFMSPTVRRYNDRWNETDSAYVKTHNNSYLSPYGTINNLYNVGTQNGKSLYNFTSFESAITNAIAFVHDFIPSSKVEYSIKAPYSISSFICHTTLIVTLIYVYKKFISK